MIEGKKAKTMEAAWDIQETYEDKPHGWIQWQGTDVCMDVYCKCGTDSHIDAEFAFYVKCENCGTIYKCNGHIELIEIEEELPDESVVVTDNDINILDARTDSMISNAAQEGK